MPTPSALLNVMIDAARKAARGLARDFGEVTELQVSKKGAADFVSNADLKAEQTLFEILTKARPGYGFLGEERGMVEGTDKTHTWIVDPLDGTTNFLRGIPHFAVSIACKYRGRLEHAVVLDPVRQEEFTASRGRGAALNGRRIRCTNRPGLEGCLIGT
ncbi:MAG: inositol monophosphatase, partial [Caulobacter sp.]|nr:inositol monophosphatase [Caulobacter sp.]